jgi:hypothetical protein
MYEGLRPAGITDKVYQDSTIHPAKAVNPANTAKVVLPARR